MIRNSLLLAAACFVLNFDIVASYCPRCPVPNDAYCPYLFSFQWSEANGDWDEDGTIGGQTKYTQQMYGGTVSLWYSDTTWMASGWSMGWYSWMTQRRMRFGFCAKEELLDCTAGEWMFYQNTDGDQVYNDPTDSPGWALDDNAQMRCWIGNGWNSVNAAVAEDGLNSNPSGAEEPANEDWVGMVFGAGIGVVAVMVVVVLLLMLKRWRNRVEKVKSTEMAKVDVAVNVEPVVDDSNTMRTNEGGDMEEVVVVDTVSA